MSTLLIILSLASLITQLQAMEIPVLNPPQETDEEFIIRAKEKCALVADKRLVKQVGGWHDRVQCESYWCEPALKIEYVPGDEGARIVVSDTKNRSQLQNTLARVNKLLAQFSSKTNHDDVTHFALSANARFLAFVKMPMDTSSLLEVLRRKNIIMIHELEVDSHEPKYTFEYEIRAFECITGIEFNNQATKLIVFGWDMLQQNPNNISKYQKYSTEHHHIFTLDSSSK